MDELDSPRTIRVEEVAQVTPETVKTLIEIDLQTFAESTFSQYTALAVLHSGQVFVLRVDDIIVGTCVCLRNWKQVDEALVLTMGIRPGWRGRGLGQRFVQGVLSALKRCGVAQVSLLVDKSNFRAIKTYQDVGFDRREEFMTAPHTGAEFVHLSARLNDEQ
jgi:ribosomal protein S18 acetylase RimI-like enzyme